jgi:hypothetical protein
MKFNANRPSMQTFSLHFSNQPPLLVSDCFEPSDDPRGDGFSLFTRQMKGSGINPLTNRQVLVKPVAADRAVPEVGQHG